MLFPPKIIEVAAKKQAVLFASNAETNKRNSHTSKYKT